jgi:hypothetical protein
MAEKKNHTLLWLGLLGIGGVVFYEWYTNRNASSQVSTEPATTAPLVTNPVVSTLIPAATTVAVVTPAAAAQSAAANPQAFVPPNGIDLTVWNTVQKWGTTDGRQPVLNMLNAAVPAEYNGMYNLITGYWDTGKTPTPAMVNFWNTLRSKYDPGDNIW